MTVKSDSRVEKLLETYPPLARKKLLYLRKLILAVAEKIDGLETIEETLKWGEPSYLTPGGSTIRIDWKPKHPDQYAIYFKCTSKLIATFKRLHKGVFHFEGDRAIVFQMGETVPEKELKQCIKATLTYHKVKQLPNLGIS